MNSVIVYYSCSYCNFRFFLWESEQYTRINKFDIFEHNISFVCSVYLFFLNKNGSILKTIDDV